MSQFQGIIAPYPLSILPHETNKEIIKSYEELIQNYLKLAHKVGEWAPDLIINMSPRGTCYLEGPTVNDPTQNQYQAILAEINQGQINFPSDKGNIHSLIKRSQEQNQTLVTSDNDILDAGSLVPLFYLNKALPQTPEMIYLNMGLTSPEKHFQLGKLLAEILSDSPKKVLFIASAALSHKLTKSSPGGYNPNAKKFDKELRQDLAQQNYESITLYNPLELDEISETAIRPICTMLGFLQNTPHQINEHCYTSPEGVGELLSSTFNLQ